MDKDGNKRPLHLEKALECLDVSKKSIPIKYKDDFPIEERMYYTRYIKNKDLYKNQEDMFSFAVMIKGNKTYEGIHVLPGVAILLEAEEFLDTSEAEEFLDTSEAEWIIVTPKKFLL